MTLTASQQISAPTATKSKRWRKKETITGAIIGVETTETLRRAIQEHMLSRAAGLTSQITVQATTIEIAKCITTIIIITIVVQASTREKGGQKSRDSGLITTQIHRQTIMKVVRSSLA